MFSLVEIFNFTEAAKYLDMTPQNPPTSPQDREIGTKLHTTECMDNVI